MAGNVRFTIDVGVENEGALPELQGRLADLAPAFEALIVEWAELNEQKFGLSAGREASGAQVDDLVFWEPLKGSTMRAKRRQGQGDQIMVATGALERALTSPDLIFQAVTAQDAVFGTPQDPMDAMKVAFQWRKRQAIFLSTIDQNALRRILKDYLEMGGDFQEKRFAAGLAAVRRSAEMDAGFDVGDTGDGF